MGEFISWYEELSGKVHFLTDADWPKAQALSINAEDFLGHGAIAAIRGWKVDNRPVGKKRECTDFSTPANFPAVIVAALKAGQMTYVPLPPGLLLPDLDDDYRAKCKPLDDDYRAKCKPLDDDYWAKRKPLDDDYWAKRDDYWAKREALDDDYRAKRKALDDDHWAKRKALDDDYWAKRKALDDDYRRLFTVPENRVEDWR